MEHIAGMREGTAMFADTAPHELTGISTLLAFLFDATHMVSDESMLLDIAALRPDMAIVDFSFPVSTEPNVVVLLQKHCATLPLVVMSTNEHPALAKSVITMGALAVVAKRSVVSDLPEAVRSVRWRKAYTSPVYG